MLKDSCDESIALEIPSYLLEILRLVILGAISPEACHRSQGKFLLRILVEHIIQPYHSIFPFLHNRNYVSSSHQSRIDAEEFFYLTIRPSPLISIIILMHTLKFGIDVLQLIDAGSLNSIKQSVNLRLRSNQTAKIGPIPSANKSIRNQPEANILIVFKREPFQPLDNGIAQEFGNGCPIQFNSLFERAIANLRTMISIHIRQKARRILQITKQFQPLQHLLDSIRAEQIVIYIIQFVRISPAIPLRPFLSITDSPNAPKIHTRHQERSIVVLNQIRKRQIAGIGMSNVHAHHQRESPYTRRPKYIRIRSSLGTSLQCPLMYRAEFIHVIALIRP